MHQSVQKHQWGNYVPVVIKATKSSTVQVVHMDNLLYRSHVINQETELQSQRSHM